MQGAVQAKRLCSAAGRPSGGEGQKLTGSKHRRKPLLSLPADGPEPLGQRAGSWSNHWRDCCMAWLRLMRHCSCECQSSSCGCCTARCALLAGVPACSAYWSSLHFLTCGIDRSQFDELHAPTHPLYAADQMMLPDVHRMRDRCQSLQQGILHIYAVRERREECAAHHVC